MKSIEKITETIEKRKMYNQNPDVDVDLSSELTTTLHKQYAETESFLFMVEKDNHLSHRNRHSVMCADSSAGKDCIAVTCTPFARLMLEILKNPALADFLPGVEITVNHEIGHIENLQYGGKLTKTYYGEKYNPEIVAELYALSKAGDPDCAINAEATFTAMYDYIFNMGVEKVVEYCFKHYSGHSNNYSFPLTDNAIEEITKHAKIYAEKLNSIVGDRFKPDYNIASFRAI